MYGVAYDPKSRLAHLAVAVKVVWALCISLWILLVRSVGGQIIIAAVLVLLAVSGGISPAKILRYVRLFLPVLALIFVLHLFYHTGEPLFSIWFLHATATGFRAGAFNVARFFNFILVAMCFLNWTSPAEFAGEVGRGFGLVRSRFLQGLALVFFIALRFLPSLVKERTTARMAMTARGADFGGGPIKRLRSEASLLLPLFVRVMRQADDVAAAIALRQHKGAYFLASAPRLRASDYVLSVLPMGITAALVLL